MADIKKCKDCQHFDRFDEPMIDNGVHIYGGCSVDYEFMYTWPNRQCQHPEEFRKRGDRS